MKYAIVALLALCFLGCGYSQEETARRERERSESFWVKHNTSPRSPGPYTYITREPIAMADGTHVVCVATLDGIWCKEAK